MKIKWRCNLMKSTMKCKLKGGKNIINYKKHILYASTQINNKTWTVRVGFHIFFSGNLRRLHCDGTTHSPSAPYQSQYGIFLHVYGYFCNIGSMRSCMFLLYYWLIVIDREVMENVKEATVNIHGILVKRKTHLHIFFIKLKTLCTWVHPNVFCVISFV